MNRDKDSKPLTRFGCAVGLRAVLVRIIREPNRTLASKFTREFYIDNSIYARLPAHTYRYSVIGTHILPSPLPLRTPAMSRGAWRPPLLRGRHWCLRGMRHAQVRASPMRRCSKHSLQRRSRDAETRGVAPVSAGRQSYSIALHKIYYQRNTYISRFGHRSGKSPLGHPLRCVCAHAHDDTPFTCMHVVARALHRAHELLASILL